MHSFLPKSWERQRASRCLDRGSRRPRLWAKVAVRTSLRAGGDLDTVTLSIEKAREMLSGMDYLEEKARLAQAAALKLDQWSSDYAQADGLPNQVVRGTISKLAPHRRELGEFLDVSTVFDQRANGR